jgi:hypothetical protein
MNIIITPVAAILIGLSVRSRLIAALLYLVIEAILFTFQTLVVLLAWMGGQGGFGDAGGEGAFGPAPTGFPLVFDEGSVWSYGLVNLGIIAAGLAITILLSWLRGRGRAKRAAGVVA